MHHSPGRVITEATLDCSPDDAWDKVCFYEHISIKPSLLLRIVLPVPEKTTGRYERVDDISRCCYSDGGYLTKRITRIRENDRIEFEIVEQSIRFHRTIRLCGGCIEVGNAGGGRSTVRMTTNYETSLKPAWLMHRAIGWVVKAMHRIVLEDMQVCLSGEDHASDAVQLQV